MESRSADVITTKNCRSVVHNHSSGMSKRMDQKHKNIVLLERAAVSEFCSLETIIGSGETDADRETYKLDGIYETIILLPFMI